MLKYLIVILFSVNIFAGSSSFRYVIMPVFPYPMWRHDKKADRYTVKNYRMFHPFFNILIEKGQNGHSGYDLSLAFYKKFFGTYVRYNITTNLELMNKFLDIGIEYRFFPKRHLRPAIAVLYKYINCNRLLEGHGVTVSIINYEYLFTRRFSYSFKSFIGGINYDFYIDSSLYFNYKIYPSVSLNFGGVYSRVSDINFYKLALGFKVRL